MHDNTVVIDALRTTVGDSPNFLITLAVLPHLTDEQNQS